MTTRRQVLGWAGLVGLGAVAGCGPDAPAPPSGPAPKDVLVLEGPDGVTVFSTATGAVLVPAGPAVVSSDGRGLARAQAIDGGTRLFSHRLPRGEQVFSGVLTGALAPRVVAPDSMLVALANPGATPYRPGRRDRTTIVIADAAGQRARLDLPGNLEPEAFDPAGRLLYVLDYVPPVAPDRYRVRVVDLASGTVQSLLTRDKTPVPSGAEEEMRGEGRQAVYDGNRDTLFTLYTHQPDHVHTRNLLDAGARAEAPHVHAFVHTLNLGGQWAYCVDLPAPFGEQPAAGHAIARDPGGRVVVVDAGSGSGLFIDPDGLTVQETFTFAVPRGPIDTATALFAPNGELMVAAGHEVVTRGGLRWSADTVVHGAVTVADRLYLGQEDGAVQVDPTTGAVLRRIATPAGTTLREAFLLS
jgi:DNA-binding beta-propeller fold protein YncE